MKNVITVIFETLTNIAEVGLFFYFIWHMLRPKDQYKHNLKYIILAGAAIMFIAVTLLNAFNLNGVFGMAVFLIMQLLFTFTFMSGSVGAVLLWPAVYTFLDLLAEGLAFFIAGRFSLSPNELMYEYPQRYVLVTTYTLSLSLFTILVSRIKNHDIKLPRKLTFALAALTITALIFIELLWDMGINLDMQHNDDRLYLIYASVAASFILIAYTMTLFVFSGRAYKEKIELEQENRNIDKKYEELKHLLESMSGTVDYQIIENRSPRVINLREVKYFESVGRSVTVHMKNGGGTYLL